MSRVSRATATSRATPSSPSWLALLTSTTLGASSALIRAEVRSSDVLGTTNDALRLVVQVYPRRALRAGRLQSWARPTASAQRAVTLDVLQQGVPVLLAGFERPSTDAHDRFVVVAWVEPGSPDLDLDGADARPQQNARVGIASLVSGQCRVKVSLRPSRQAA